MSSHSNTNKKRHISPTDNISSKKIHLSTPHATFLRQHIYPHTISSEKSIMSANMIEKEDSVKKWDSTSCQYCGFSTPEGTFDFEKWAFHNGMVMTRVYENVKHGMMNRGLFFEYYSCPKCKEKEAMCVGYGR